MTRTFRITGVVSAALALAAAPLRAQVAGAPCAEKLRVVEESVTGDTPPPSWASSDVPERVWRLLEAAVAARADERLRNCFLDAAEAAARETPDSTSTQARFASAVVLGIRADISGGRAKVSAASALHEQLRALLETAPDHARARHMLGRLHAAVRRMNSVTRWLATRVLGGEVLRNATWDEAEHNLAFAEQAAPDVLEHHLQLANLYRDTGRRELALVEYRHVLELPAETPMEAAARDEALEFIEALEKR